MDVYHNYICLVKRRTSFHGLAIAPLFADKHEYLAVQIITRTLAGFAQNIFSLPRMLPMREKMRFRFFNAKSRNVRDLEKTILDQFRNSNITERFLSIAPHLLAASL